MPAASLSSLLELSDGAPPPLPPPPPTSARMRFPALVPVPGLRRAPGAAEEDLVPEGEEEDATLPRTPGAAWLQTNSELERLVSALLGEPEEPTLPGGDSDPTNPGHRAAIREARDTALLDGACVFILREVDDEQELVVLAGDSRMPQESGMGSAADPYLPCSPAPELAESAPPRDEPADVISYPRESEAAHV